MEEQEPLRFPLGSSSVGWDEAKRLCRQYQGFFAGDSADVYLNVSQDTFICVIFGWVEPADEDEQDQ